MSAAPNYSSFEYVPSRYYLHAVPDLPPAEGVHDAFMPPSEAGQQPGWDGPTDSLPVVVQFPPLEEGLDHFHRLESMRQRIAEGSGWPYVPSGGSEQVGAHRDRVEAAVSATSMGGTGVVLPFRRVGYGLIADGPEGRSSHIPGAEAVVSSSGGATAREAHLSLPGTLEELRAEELRLATILPGLAVWEQNEKWTIAHHRLLAVRARITQLGAGTYGTPQRDFDDTRGQIAPNMGTEIHAGVGTRPETDAPPRAEITLSAEDAAAMAALRAEEAQLLATIQTAQSPALIQSLEEKLRLVQYELGAAQQLREHHANTAQDHLGDPSLSVGDDHDLRWGSREGGIALERIVSGLRKL